MALDIQRPDPSSPAAVASAQFTLVRRGYSEEEVRDFLRQVSVEIGRLIERERFLQNELKALQARGPVDVSTIDEAAVAELLGAEAARVLTAAREAAQAMRDRAAESAETIVREASREATRLLEEANTEASRRRTDVSSEAEQEIELAKQQGREMVAEVREYRERVLADVARRTEEARRELERLVQERERLITAFERARHAATGVVGDLNAFDDAIREVGIVPPLAPPDAPPPPRPTRNTDTQFFDARKFEDPNADHTPDRGIATATTPVETTTTDTDEPTHNDERGHQEDSIPTDTTTTEETPVVDEPQSTAPESTLVDEVHTGETIAEVVNLFDHRRKKEETAPKVELTPLHPVFERVEAQPVPAVPSTTDAPVEKVTGGDKVDELFQRLRAASSHRVATETSTDLAKSESEALRSDQAIFEHRAATIATVHSSMMRVAKRLLADDENAIITHLGGKRTALHPEAVLPEMETQSRRYTDALREDLATIAVEAARTIHAGRRADLRTSAFDGVMDGASRIIVNDFLRHLHDQVRVALQEHGNNRDALVGAVRNMVKRLRLEKLNNAVTDVAHFAYARGLFTTCDAKTLVCWVVDAGGPACADAQDNSLAGKIRHGEPFPTGHVHPLAHDGCRCLVIPADK